MTAQMHFVEPNKRVRLGAKKFAKIQRGQDIVEGFAWLSAVAIVAMFLIDGGVKSITDIATFFSALSRVAALVATDLLLIHTLLVARVPWIDRLYGHDRATHTHKKLGKPVLYLVILHFVAEVIGFALSDKKNVIDEYFTMLKTLQDMLTATAGLVLMIVVVVTSLEFARRKLSYEFWYIVHLLGYAAILAAVPHQFSTGTDIAGKPIQTFYWISLYLFVLGNILWFRVLAPFVMSYERGLKISKVVPESSDSVSIYVGGKNLKSFGSQSGQFFLLRVMNAKQWWRPHPFSLSAAPSDQHIRFTIARRGDDTAMIQKLKPGTRVVLEGPYGIFTEDRRTREKVTLIAAGIGAPPIRALAESMAARPGDINIIYRVRNEADAPLIAELGELARRRGFKLNVLEGQRGDPKSWMPAGNGNVPDQARLVEMAPWVSESDVFVCGPAAWTRQVVKTLHRVGTPENQIHAEEFAW
jgi:predicted ferric reductase